MGKNIGIVIGDEDKDRPHLHVYNIHFPTEEMRWNVYQVMGFDNHMRSKVLSTFANWLDEHIKKGNVKVQKVKRNIL